jgi:hypothetical protein
VATASIDGSSSLVPESDLIWQTTSSWNETTPVLSDSVVYSMGTFQTSTELFDISADTLEKITLYVWLEGQDVDCTNAASPYETSILANIQFTTAEQEENNTGITRDK